MQIRFIRQKPIENYILDFYCPKMKIGIEVDGNQHYTKEGKKCDAIRTEVLNAYGIKIIRFTNKEIRKNFNKVCELIDYIIENISDVK